ncbi:hypothetical protein CEE39_04165 [bacterium (candidate division B38) B3_B38]|nr:MAG: hypothetical protein CEE39_04165 [bacterium (candidate division B38) B3_B38]
MEIKPVPPFNFGLTASYLHILPPAKYSQGTYSRVLRLLSGKLVSVLVKSVGSVNSPRLSISTRPQVSQEEQEEIKDTVSFMFSTGDDVRGFYSMAEKDPVLKRAVKELRGLKIQSAPTLFEELVIGFCLQWVSFQRGVEMIDCLVRKFGERVDDLYAFPSPGALAAATLEEIKGCKLGFRAKRVKWAAEMTASGWGLEQLGSLPDDELKNELLKIKWVGPWTAEGLLLWRFKRYNAFPLDVWSAKIFQSFYPQLKDKSLDEISEFASQSWGDYKGLAYYYLMCHHKNLAQKRNTKSG